MGRQFGAFALVCVFLSSAAFASGVPELVADPVAFCAHAVANTRREAVVLADRYILPSKARSDKGENSGKMFQLKGHAHGMLLNGKVFPEFDVHFLPKAGVPVAIAGPRFAKPKARLYLLHGLGYSISTVYSVVQTSLMLQRIAEGGGGNPFAEWFARRYPELRIPVETVIYDVPPMGWSPSLAQLPTGEAIGMYFRGIADELQEQAPLDDFYVCRSASCAPGLIAAETAKGIVMTGATFPNPAVLEANRVELVRMQLSGKEKPRWDIINVMLARFNALSFYQRLEQAAKSPVPVRSLIGSEDAETPEDAQLLWEDLLDARRGGIHRSQLIIPRAKHQVFRRPDEASPTAFSEDDPDVVAFVALLEFLKAHIAP